MANKFDSIYESLKHIKEDSFNITTSDGSKGLSKFEFENEQDEVVDVINPQAENEEELQEFEDSFYLGKYIGVCDICANPSFLEKEDISNPFTCPYCFTEGATFQVVGKVESANGAEEPQEEPEVETEEEDEETLEESNTKGFDINSAYALYELMNDWLIDYDSGIDKDMDEETLELLEWARDEYEEIYPKLRKTYSTSYALEKHLKEIKSKLGESKNIAGKPKALKESKKSKKQLNEELKILTSISDYEPWSGARDTWDKIADADKVDELESYLEDIYPDGITMTGLNDILWFDGEQVLLDLGVITEEEYNELTESKKLKEEVSNEAYAIAEIMNKELSKLGKTITRDDFDEQLALASRKILKIDSIWSEINKDNGKISPEELQELETDVRGILSQEGWETEFEGDNEGGLKKLEESKKLKEDLSYEDLLTIEEIALKTFKEFGRDKFVGGPDTDASRLLIYNLRKNGFKGQELLDAINAAELHWEDWASEDLEESKKLKEDFSKTKKFKDNGITYTVSLYEDPSGYVAKWEDDSDNGLGYNNYGYVSYKNGEYYINAENRPIRRKSIKDRIIKIVASLREEALKESKDNNFEIDNAVGQPFDKVSKHLTDNGFQLTQYGNVRHNDPTKAFAVFKDKNNEITLYYDMVKQGNRDSYKAGEVFDFEISSSSTINGTYNEELEDIGKRYEIIYLKDGETDSEFYNVCSKEEALKAFNKKFRNKYKILEIGVHMDGEYTAFEESKQGFVKKYKGCSIHDTGDNYTVTDQHGTTIGTVKTLSNAEWFIDDYNNSNGIKESTLNEELEYISAEEASKHVLDNKGKITVLGNKGYLGVDFYSDKDDNIVASNFELGPIVRTKEEFDLSKHLNSLEKDGFKFVKSDDIKNTEDLHINNSYKVESKNKKVGELKAKKTMGLKESTNIEIVHVYGVKLEDQELKDGEDEFEFDSTVFSGLNVVAQKRYIEKQIAEFYNTHVDSITSYDWKIQDELKESTTIQIKGDADIEVESEDNVKVDVEGAIKDQVIAPLSDEEQEEVEELKDITDDLDDAYQFEDVNMSKLVTNFLKENFSDVRSYKVNKVRSTKQGLVVEGLITYKNKGTKKTVFTFENFNKNSRTLKVKGDSDVFGMAKAFILEGVIKNKKVIPTSLKYNFKQTFEGVAYKVFGKALLD